MAIFTSQVFYLKYFYVRFTIAGDKAFPVIGSVQYSSGDSKDRRIPKAWRFDSLVTQRVDEPDEAH
jgi:hypothetical protein